VRRRAKRLGPSWPALAAAGGFLAGVIVTAAGFTLSRPGPAPAAGGIATSIQAAGSEEVVPSPEAPPPEAPPVMSADPVAELRRRQLILPVQGVERDELRDTFDETRGGTRRHEAMDVLAPRNTPVLAVEDGTVARLFLSEAGGITIYQFDPSDTYVYYYAHLERYADGLKEGAPVERGQVIGHVGTTGNAPRDTPHLHFAIFRMAGEKKWWQGTAIDPYAVLR
jgi:murein DD-endopeptidase MepM/ murein hydrolase activator NlpD